jgi:uncharacterized membrane protein
MMTGWLGPEAPSIKRLTGAVLVGLVTVVAVMAFSPWQLNVLLFWDGTVATFLLAVWLHIFGLDSVQTAAAATREDETRGMTRFVLLVASTVSLAGVGLALVKADQEGGTSQIVISVFAVVTIILSWGVVHTVYVLRYAHLYYNPPPGGIDFSGDEPNYLDFAYLAFTLGMTYQVSDTDIQDQTIRRTVLAHTLLSYVFGTVIIAATINVVAGFVH